MKAPTQIKLRGQAAQWLEQEATRLDISMTEMVRRLIIEKIEAKAAQS